MSLSRTVLNLIAATLRSRARQHTEVPPENPRILVIRRNRMGDMICTLPLLHALRKHYPTAHLAVACDPPGAPIAGACEAVNEVIVLKPGWNRWQAVIRNAAQLQDYNWVIATKGGFDLRLAALARLTNATRRIGFESVTNQISDYYTDAVALPQNPHDEHQIETALRLLQPLGLSDCAVDLTLALPQSAQEFAAALLTKPPFAQAPRFMLINISSTTSLKFSSDDFVSLARRLLEATDFIIGFVSAPADQPKAQELAARIASHRVIAVNTPGPLELAALLKHATFLLTPEGGAAHLAAAMNTPALVLWSEGPFQKWHSRGARHTFVRHEPEEAMIPQERVWRALQPYLILPSR